MRRALGTAWVVSLVLAPCAQAGQPRTHDGIFLRLAGGVAFANTEIEDGDESLEFSDIGGDGNFAIGGIVAHNLALHGTLWGWALNDADGELNDQEFDSNVAVTMSAIGGGLTYYFGPSNLYLSGSVGMGSLDFHDEDDTFDGDTDHGVVVTALLGKEWWVGNSWGLGLAGEVNYHSFSADFVDENFDGISFGVLFSATLN